jgi:hypothetical protein
MKKQWIIIYAALLCAISASARVKLTAVPERAATGIRLDERQTALIEEERTLTLQQGRNQVDFSWKGVHIDPDSIRLNILSHPDSVNLLSVSYPPGEDALVWDISSGEAAEVRVRISYLLAGLDRLITYKTVVDKEETAGSFKSHAVLRNFSGEDFSKADVIIDNQLPLEQLNIQHEETAQLLLENRDNVPIRKVWTFDAAKLPWDPELQQQNVGIPVHYEIPNTTAAGFGRAALPAGKVRVYQQDGTDGGTIFLGEDRLPLVPVGEDLEITIGDSRDIVVTQRKIKNERINVRRNRSQQIILYDTEETIRAEVENFKDTPATLTMLQHIPGEWKMNRCNMDYKREDISTLEFTIDLPPGGKKELIMNYSRLNIR